MKKNITFLILIFSFTLYSNLIAEPTEKELKTILPSFLNLSNEAREYWFTIPPCFVDESFGFNNYVKIFVTSKYKTPVTVSVPGKNYSVSKISIPNDVIEFNLQPDIGHPFVKSGKDPNVPEQIFSSRGVHVVANAPIVVYVVVRYYKSSDGFLAIPVASLGTEYIIAGTKVDALFRAVWNYKLPNMTGIVAAFDNTKVSFTLGGNSVTRTAGGMTPGQTKEAILMKGDVWMFSTDSDEAELSGSKILATKPVAVVTANQCANIPTGNGWCDYIVEMEIPTMSWGYNLFVPTVPQRKYSSVIKIFAKEPNTKIFKNGKQIGFLPDAGGVEGRAFLDMRMIPLGQQPKPVVISGNKPINVVLYNTGSQEDGGPPSITGDPFSLNILPYELFQKDILFCTPGINDGQNFSLNYINLVYESDSFGTVPDDLEFAKVVDGKFEWVKVKEKFTGAGVVFDYKFEGKSFSAKHLELDGDGVYKIRGDKPFAAYSMGFNTYDSYAYPTSGVFPDLNKYDTMPPIATIFPGDSIIESGQYKGIVTDMPEESHLRSNLAKIDLSFSDSYNFSLSYDEFIPGETRTTNWYLYVMEPEKDARATIKFYDRRGNLTELKIERIVNQLAATPQIVDFGKKKVGNYNLSMQVVLSNIINDTIQINQNDLIFKHSFFELLGIGSYPFTLKPGDNVMVQIKPKNLSEGIYIDTLVFSGNTFKNITVLIAKIQYVKPKIQVADVLDFGKKGILEDFVTYKSLMINNIGEFEDSIFRFALPKSPEFTTIITNIDDNGNLNQPYSLAPSSGFEIQVGFKPTEIKHYLDSITVYTDAYPQGLKTILKGEGVLVNNIEVTEILQTKILFANQTLTIETENIESVAIFNLTGSLVLSEELKTPQNFINITNINLSSGFYIIKLKSSTSLKYSKILIY